MARWTDLIMMGWIPLTVGIYGTLLAYRVIPLGLKDPDKIELWHRKFGKLMKIIGPIIIIGGILALIGFR